MQVSFSLNVCMIATGNNMLRNPPDPPIKRVKTGKTQCAVPLDKKTLAKRRKKHSLWKKYMDTEEGKIYSIDVQISLGD